MEKTNRASRELDTREQAERPKQWMPPQTSTRSEAGSGLCVSLDQNCVARKR